MMSQVADTPQMSVGYNNNENGKKYNKNINSPKTKYDVIIIGGGPAGYTAGIYCSRGGYSTLVLSGILPGGQLINTTDVENYPGFKSGIMGPDLMMEIREQCKNMGTEIIDYEVTNVDFRDQEHLRVLTESFEYEARAIIIATGATPKKLGLKGEQAFAGRGVSYCATCDGPFFKGQSIIVAGGGDSAIEEALFLTKFGKDVHIIHRRDELRASKAMQNRAFTNEKIKFHWDSKIIDIAGDQKIQNVTLQNVKTEQKETLDAGALFVAIGHVPNTQLFKGQIDCDAKGYIELKDGKQHTNAKGVFAAGDVHDSIYRQAVTAAGFGCMAALDVNDYLST